ncbi:MAG TPA: histidine phosphatase family protein, partial [Ilumatobacteraceae bacterium]|nr:histidine phosphatase family protein [Ilumatobacteraceae bacterium]
GRMQSERLRDRLAATGEIVADAIVSSQFPRARETAEIVAPALGGLPVVEDERFGEHDPGEECDGMLFSEFIDRFGELNWEADPYAVGFPGG